jgi:hypothetical protein
MISGDQLAILYSSGARGDFLAAVLLDKLKKFTTYNQLTIQLPVDYKKIHTLPDSRFHSQYTMSLEEIGQYTSIRIKLEDLGDLLNVAYLWTIKLPEQLNPGLVNILDYLLEQELLFRQYDMVFDYVVEFKDLFDIDAIKQLYRNINQQDLPDEYANNICHNIKLQPRVDQLNYAEYFPRADLIDPWLTANLNSI